MNHFKHIYLTDWANSRSEWKGEWLPWRNDSTLSELQNWSFINWYSLVSYPGHIHICIEWSDERNQGVIKTFWYRSLDHWMSTTETNITVAKICYDSASFILFGKKCIICICHSFLWPWLWFWLFLKQQVSLKGRRFQTVNKIRLNMR